MFNTPHQSKGDDNSRSLVDPFVHVLQSVRRNGSTVPSEVNGVPESRNHTSRPSPKNVLRLPRTPLYRSL